MVSLGHICALTFGGDFLIFITPTFVEFLEKHYGLSRSKYPDVSLGNSLKERNKKTNPNLYSFFFSREQKKCSAGDFLANYPYFPS